MRLITNHNNLQTGNYIVTVRRCAVDTFMCDKATVFKIEQKDLSSCDICSNEKSARGVLVVSSYDTPRFRFAYKNEAKLCSK